jgi:hypothetical protein
MAHKETTSKRAVPRGRWRVGEGHQRMFQNRCSSCLRVHKSGTFWVLRPRRSREKHGVAGEKRIPLSPPVTKKAGLWTGLFRNC